MTCEGILLEGKIEVPYKGTAILTYEDGVVDKRDVMGIYTGVGAFDSQVEIGKPSRLSERDENLEAGETLQVKKSAKRQVLEKTIALE